MDENLRKNVQFIFLQALKHLISIFFWIVGISFFLAAITVFVLASTFLSRKKLYLLVRIICRCQLHLMGVCLKVNGWEYFDPHQNYIIMGNHQSLFDIFAIPAAIPRPFIAIEADYHFNIPIWGCLMKKLGNIPIARENISSAIKSLDFAKKVILSGQSLLILPEGHRTMDGKIAQFKKGPFHLALNTRTPILPFAIHGLYQFHNKHSYLLHPWRRVTINFGPPIPYQQYGDKSVDEVTSQIFKIINQL